MAVTLYHQICQDFERDAGFTFIAARQHANDIKRLWQMKHMNADVTATALESAFNQWLNSSLVYAKARNEGMQRVGFEQFIENLKAQI